MEEIGYEVTDIKEFPERNICFGVIYIPGEGRVNVAIKIRDQKQNSHECEMLQSLDGKNVVRCFGMGYYVDFNGNRHYGVITERAISDLVDYYDSNYYDFDLPLKITILHRIAKCIEYIHNMGVYHNDIKLDNILVREMMLLRPDVCLFDFDQSQMFGNLNQCEYGTPQYAPPETGKGPLTPKADVFAFGCCILYFLMDIIPRMGPIELYRRARGRFCSKELFVPFIEILDRIMVEDPSDRPTMGEIVELLGSMTSSCENILSSLEPESDSDNDDFLTDNTQ